MIHCKGGPRKIDVTMRITRYYCSPFATLIGKRFTFTLTWHKLGNLVLSTMWSLIQSLCLFFTTPTEGRNT